MLSLRTEGFARLVSAVADKARLSADAAKMVRTALTLDDRVDEESGLAALTPADRVVVESVQRSDVRLDCDADTALFLTGTGRLAVGFDDLSPPHGAYRLGAVRWADGSAGQLRSRWQRERAATGARLTALRDELAAGPAGTVGGSIDRIEYAVAHMAPVLIYVNDAVYSNLGKGGNLPGKSLPVGHDRSVLTRLRRTPVTEWEPEDACFVACLDALLRSGPPVRAEEFNGVQLNPDTLMRFLAGSFVSYGVPPPRIAPGLPALREHAAACGRLRAEAVSGGLLPYRVINGLNLHKHEHLMSEPGLLADAPKPVTSHLAGLLGADPLDADPLGADPDTAGTAGTEARIDGIAPLCADLARRLVGAPVPDGFSSAFEAELHAMLTVVAEAFAADVSMSRGPARFDPLRDEPAADPFRLGTGDFYCCVAPRGAFVDRFGADRQGLARTLAAYSARMRFNTWHYLPHTLGIVEREPGRDDWFFAPTMPDVTCWSDQHHTGHVAFGVRNAIRVPFGIDYDGRALPGLYDLRLLRTDPPPFTVDDLRRAVATAAILRQLYQAMSVYTPQVVDFGKHWYERFHG